MGIGTVWGFNPGWTAGAIISGAYFGDKVSPLSDTTVLAASTCSVPLFSHIRYMMFTTVPAMSLALIVFGIVGITMDVKEAGVQSAEMTGALHAVFNISPWVLVVPLFTILVLLLRAGTLLTLVLGTLAGIVAVFLFQPQLLPIIDGDAAPDVWSHIKGVIGMLSTETSLDTGNELLDSLTTTGGMAGMLPTITLVLSAMVFASALMGTGMLFTITHSITSRLRKSRNIVYSTVATGLVLNSCTGDQYLSIILNGNLYRNLYRRRRLEPRLLSRSIEDSTSVTSVLIPWNSCGLTQSTVLGVATLTYLPYCLFNILSPVMTIVVASIGYRLHQRCNTIITSEPSESVVAMRR